MMSVSWDILRSLPPNLMRAAGFFFNDTATTEIYTLSLHDALPISQVTQLIARRVREAHVYCEVHPCDVSSDWVREFAADGRLKGVILSGSHASVYEVDDRAPDAVFELGIPDRKSTRLNSSHTVISY